MLGLLDINNVNLGFKQTNIISCVQSKTAVNVLNLDSEFSFIVK